MRASSTPTEARALARCALLVAVGALALNEWLAARLAPDGTLEHSTRVLIRLFQVACLAGAGGLFVLRRRLGGLFRDERRWLRLFLVLGIVLRVAVYPFLGPDNNDPHREVVEYVAEHGWTPTADEATLGFQPPLYYVLAAPWALTGEAKVVQLFSLLLSIANLLVLYRLIATTRLLQDPRARCHAFLLAALLPQFVFFGLYVSNDALAFPLGSLAFAAMFAWVERPSTRRLLALGALTGLGLATKGTFTAFVPVTLALVLALGLYLRRGAAAIARDLVLVGVVIAALGCYKFVENLVVFGTPVVDNDVLQQAWVEHQAGTVQGFRSFVDFDLPRLVRYPYAAEETRHSLPLLFYGTFWYAYIHESNLDATRRHPWTVLPRAQYLCGLLPTVLMALGLVAWAARSVRSWRFLRLPREAFDARLLETAVYGVLLLNLATVMSWGLRHDAWSFFQSRLLFTAFLGLALLLGQGFELVARRLPGLAAVCNLALLLPWAAALAWIGVEIGCQLAGTG